MISGVRGTPRPEIARHSLDFGLKRLKDIAFEHAIEGQMVPVFVGGKLMGFQRKRNDALLMFCLRHYGQDGEGKRTTVNYFRTSASASASASAGATDGAGGEARASVTAVGTVTRGDAATALPERDDALADVLNGFAGVDLDEQALGAIAAALEGCAARARDGRAASDAGGEAAVVSGMDDVDEPFVRVAPTALPWRGELVAPVSFADDRTYLSDEADWTLAGADVPDWTGAGEGAAELPSPCRGEGQARHALG